jgi:hypothetical protein
MARRTEVLYREAPCQPLEPIDEASIPDYGCRAIGSLLAENERRDRLLWIPALAFWMALAALVLGIATFRQMPLIAIFAFVAARDVAIVIWVSRDRAGLVKKAIEEIMSLQGAERIAREIRLREAIAAWNADASDCGCLLMSTEWLSISQHNLLREAQRLGDRRQSLIAEIQALRGDPHAAA